MKPVILKLSHVSIKLLTIHLLLISFVVSAQEKTVTKNNQLWLGYISSTTINKHYSLWNDVHLVPEGFFVARTGINRQVKNVGITAGYAFLRLPVSANKTQLQRNEHRPWVQLLINHPVSTSVSFVSRVRFDARFKQDVAAEELLSTYGYVNRIRFLKGFRINVTSLKTEKSVPYFSLADEVLLNFGKAVTNNTFDQNRIQLSLGVQRKTTQYQLGYMNRFVQTGNERYTLNHTITFWVIQKFSLGNRNSNESIKPLSHEN
ncbi:MAG: DUF2490 domain-containing protein [Cytophagia bacterium]|nr:DUF2490 domain-containing protein [Cytophagia bacterium]